MSAALECWSGRPSTDEDMVEQVLMKTHDRSEAFTLPPPPNNKRWQRLGRRFAGAIADLKSSLTLTLTLDSSPSPNLHLHPHPSRLDKLLWSAAVRRLSQLYPDRLFSNIRHHFDSLPNSYAQAGFDMKEVLLHVRLVEQAAAEDHPAFHIHEVPGGGAEGLACRLTFASISPLSWPVMSVALDASLVCFKKIQIFEKKGLTLGVVTLLVLPGGGHKFKPVVEAALKSAVKRSSPPVTKNGGVKIPFSLCGCQEESSNNPDEEEVQLDREDHTSAECEVLHRIQLPAPLPESSLLVSVDEWQTVCLGTKEMGRWLLNADEIEFIDQAGTNSFNGVHRGKKVWIKQLRGCEQGSAYEVEIRQDLLQLMTCGHRNILQFHGVCIEDNHGLCVVMRMMDGGSVHDLIQKSRKLAVKEIVRIAVDAAEGLKFMNDHGVAYRDLNVQGVLLDRLGNACLGDMGIITSCGNAGEVMEYETAGYRWLAPEIIAGDPESVTETWMSNVYSFGMVVWEMVTGEEAYSSYSPVQAAVGIAACGLRPEISKDCPQFLRSLMLRCWNNCPSKRPSFSEIIDLLQMHNNR